MKKHDILNGYLSLCQLRKIFHLGFYQVYDVVLYTCRLLVLKLTFFFYLQTILPASARDVYYRDEIGNISTSSMRELDDMVELELRPRFPLFGGWKTHYIMGYNVPSYQYLYNSGKNVHKKLTLLLFFCHTFLFIFLGKLYGYYRYI